MEFKKSSLVVILALISIFALTGCSTLKSTVEDLASNVGDFVASAQQSEAVASEVVVSSESNEATFLQESEILMIIEKSYPHAKVLKSAYDKENNLYNAQILDQDNTQYDITINACTGEVLKLESTPTQDAAKEELSTPE